jgi:hypothetical protein
MVTKLNSKTHLKIGFSFSLSIFFCTSKLAKCAYMNDLKKYNFFQNAIGVLKMQNLMLISNPLKKLQKDSCEKVTKKWSFLLLLLCAKVFAL